MLLNCTSRTSAAVLMTVQFQQRVHIGPVILEDLFLLQTIKIILINQQIHEQGSYVRNLCEFS
jgi:hypothetical protein